ncbi:helix-turn-helix transcriptional regulator [Thalassotalea sp. PLHSN55]|uniref:helix-turn-helix transcriptional regulator n=1 Tax=Thalassotalea sp. PLHSN55 TaxID=3435888 RepID=UPI003F83457F
MRDVYCEPFRIERGYQFEIHQVSYQKNEPYSCFMHFHEVHEFIIFDEIDGNYFYNLGQTQLQSNDIVFTPALEAHDFELSTKAKSWHIVQILPEFFESVGLVCCENFFKQGMHLRIPPEEKENINQLVKWLLASYEQNPNSQKSLTLLKLLVLWISEHSKPVQKAEVSGVNHAAGYDKLLPVINYFRQNEEVDLSMIDAASLCHMSPSHFSRQFKRVFRVSFSEYLLRHKLYQAARLLSRGKVSITDISYNLNFSSPSHFISQFKKQFDSTPLQYQKALFNKTDTVA